MEYWQRLSEAVHLRDLRALCAFVVKAPGAYFNAA